MLAPGDLLQERFLVEGEIGRGGMGTLYRAIDRSMSCPVGIKVLTSGTREDRERFSREAAALFALEHPAIVRYVTDGCTSRGEPYIVMEWLEGEDLAKRLERGPLTVDECRRIGARVADALGYAHARGLVHRDVKPSNIFIPGGDIAEVKLLDFGLVRFLGDGPRHTRSGLVLGTPGYLAPEQARSAKDIDARADVFALGCVLYEALSGRPAFEGDHLLAILTKIVFAESARVSTLRPGIPGALDDLVARMLAKEPADRPRDGHEVVRELDEGVPHSTRRGVDLAEAPRRSAPSKSAEQRLLSVVLARAADDAPRHETVQVLRPDGIDPVLADVRVVVLSHEARMAELADGSIVVVVSGTGAATDQAARACRIAVALRGCLKGWSVALATGLGDDDGGLPVGSVVDRAANILGLPGVIRLDELTAGLVEARFVVQRSDTELCLVSERTGGPVARLLLGKPTPCVGRERERATLVGLFDQSRAEWISRVALVTGAAGTGKSRLRDDIVREIGGGVWTLFGQGDELRAGAPYGMVIQALREAIGPTEGDRHPDGWGAAPSLDAQELDDFVARHVAPPDVSRVSAFLGELLGVARPGSVGDSMVAARRDAELMRQQVLQAFLDLLGGVLTQGPAIIVLEDLQWGDGPSVRLVDIALERLADRPLFVLALARPEVHELFPELWSGRDALEIVLPPLSSRAGERLVRAVLGDLPAERVRRIVEQSSGNAFFLEELIRAEAASAGDGLPPTVLAMVQARLSTLDAAARRVLCWASVLGRSFRTAALEDLLAPLAPQSLAGILAELGATELLQSRASPRFPGQSEHVFRHDLVREGAYSMLHDQDRADAHLAAADWLERHGEADPAVLARHLERGGRPARAAHEYLRAAHLSLDGGDFEGGIERARAGVRCGPEDDVLAQLLLLEGQALTWRGDASAAEVVLARAKTLVPGPGDAQTEAIAWLGVVQARLTKMDAAIGTARELLTVALPRENLLRVTRAARSLIMFCVQAGQMTLSDDLLGKIESWVSADAPDPLLLRELDEARAVRALSQNDYATFFATMQSTYESYERTGDSLAACRSGANLAFALCELGQHERAETILREVVIRCDRMGLHRVGAASRQNLGLALARWGRFSEGREALGRSIATFHALNDPGNEATSRFYLAMVEACDGALEEAEREVQSAADALVPFPASRAGALALLSRVLVAQGRLAQAVPIAQEAMSILTNLGWIEECESLVYLAYVEVMDGLGDRAAADAALRKGRERLRIRAGKIADPAFRRSFLTRVPENAELEALAAARLAEEVRG